MFKADIYNKINANERVEEIFKAKYTRMFVYWDWDWFSKAVFNDLYAMDIPAPHFILFEPYIYGDKESEALFDQFIEITLDFIKHKAPRIKTALENTEEVVPPQEFYDMFLEEKFDLYYIKRMCLLNNHF